MNMYEVALKMFGISNPFDLYTYTPADDPICRLNKLGYEANMADTSDIEPVAVFATLVGGVVVKYIFSAVVASRRGRDYELVGEVASLTCYPIKSCGGFNVRTGDCTNIGLRVDGNVLDRWVLGERGGEGALSIPVQTYIGYIIQVNHIILC